MHAAGEPALCRDCGAATTGVPPRRCAACGSPRVLRHPELNQLAIAHLDCDAFYATVEKRDDPSLANRPVIVGGGRRGVVSTACYIARLYGVHSAMPMFKALAACPDAVVLRPDMAKYRAVSQSVRRLMDTVAARVQPVSIDEAYLDLSDRPDPAMPPAARLADLARRIEDDVGITVSIGLSHNKFLAKLASDLDKPRGFSVVGRAEAKAFLAPLPVTRLPGVGPALARRLRGDGINLCRQLQDRDPDWLARRYGSMGRQLARMAQADDGRRVEPRGPAQSISTEITLPDDTGDPARLAGHLEAQCDRLAARLTRADLGGRTVVLKLKSAAFQIRTYSATLNAPTQRADVLLTTALPMLRRAADGTQFRLIGIGVSNLTQADQADPPSLLDSTTPGAAQRAPRA